MIADCSDTRLLQNTSDMCASFRTRRYKNVEKHDIFYSGWSVFLVSLLKEQSDSVKACRQAGVVKGVSSKFQTVWDC